MSDWQEQAACARPGVDPVWFELGHGELHQRALNLCEQCPVRAQCLADARKDRSCFGQVRGGVWFNNEAVVRQIRSRIVWDHEPGKPVSRGNYNAGCRCLGCCEARLEWDREYAARRRSSLRVAV